ncbi:MAG: ABC transporter permease [Candidatus Kariarchaeaceae archaeon]|jgi:tungstate transport system permease protein
MGLLQDIIESLLILFSSQEVWTIASLSIAISASAVAFASIIGIPIGITWGLQNGKSRRLSVALLNTGMGLPPVLVGLVVFLVFTKRGPLGSFEILFTPAAMVIAQMILTLPIVIGITRSTIHDLPDQFSEMLVSLGANRKQQYQEIFHEARSGILIAIIVALGRAFSEVGAILIVGGNIRYRTRVLTTAIITEIGMGERTTALALGILLLSISFTLTASLTLIQSRSNR